MKREVYISGTSCITPLGFDVESNIEAIEKGISGIKQHSDVRMMTRPFYAAMIEDAMLDEAFAEVSNQHFTKLEKMMILAVKPLITDSFASDRTGFILSTTKGNITSLASEAPIESAHLSSLANTISGFFGFKSGPIVISNACVSGIMAVAVAKRLIRANLYDEVFVAAGDLVSEFVMSGFNSFQAISDLPCRPYSKNRNGVTLGEAAAAVLVTSDNGNAKVKILGEASINDANHISGPSRTGEGLALSIESAMNESDLNATQIGYISAHGTATQFNDEMEAIAFSRLGLNTIPVNSFKGIYGHTLGASGLLETVIGIESLLRNRLYASVGFDESGVSVPLNVIEANRDQEIHYFLKTASGFGGCNTAVVFEKMNRL